VSELASLIPEAGFAAHVWFDAPLSDGATPETWMRLDDVSAGSLQFGGAVCGAPCSLIDLARADDEQTRESTSGSPMNVAVVCQLADVPTMPAGGLVLLGALLGLTSVSYLRRSHTGRAGGTSESR
jgi:hypothetical protein